MAAGGYILGGTVINTANNGDDIMLMKLDGHLQIEWITTYSGSADDTGQQVITLSDGSYALCGRTKSHGSETILNVYIVRVDSSGN